MAQRAEVYALMEALKRAKGPVEIISDSEYTVEKARAMKNGSSGGVASTEISGKRSRKD